MTIDRSHGQRQHRQPDGSFAEHHREHHRPGDQQRPPARARTTARAASSNGLLPALNGTDPIGTNYSKSSEFPNFTISANMDWVASPKFLVSVQGGYRSSDQHDSNVTEQPRYIWTTTNNVGLLDVPAQPAARHELHQHPDQHQGDSRSADARLLPGRRHGLRPRRRRTPGQVRRPDGPDRQQRAERRIAQPGHDPLEHSRSRPACRSRAAPTATTKSAATRSTRSRAA